MPLSVSKNLHRALVTARQLTTKDCLAMVLARFVVSEDLHRPLARSARSDGKRYSAEVLEPEKSPGPETLRAPPSALVGGGTRKAFKEAPGGGKQREARSMSVWDLLLPLLQCPVNLDYRERR